MFEIECPKCNSSRLTAIFKLPHLFSGDLMVRQTKENGMMPDTITNRRDELRKAGFNEVQVAYLIGLESQPVQTDLWTDEP